jgi:hypothetical protein
MKTILWLLLLAGALGACMPERRERQHGEALQQEMRSKKLKRLTQSQIIAACQKEGIHLASQLAKILDLGPGTGCDSIRLVGTVSSPVLLDYDFLCLGQAEPPTHAKARLVWEAYQQSAKNNQPVSENLQKLDDNTMLYTVPVQSGGRLLGMWSIVMDRREIIKLM